MTKLDRLYDEIIGELEKLAEATESPPPLKTKRRDTLSTAKKKSVPRRKSPKSGGSSTNPTTAHTA